MKVVLDTNVLVSGVFWSGPASHVLEPKSSDKDYFPSDWLHQFGEIENLWHGHPARVE